MCIAVCHTENQNGFKSILNEAAPFQSKNVSYLPQQLIHPHFNNDEVILMKWLRVLLHVLKYTAKNTSITVLVC